MKVDAKLVKKLHDETGATYIDAKKALEASELDFEAAKKWLRKHGVAKAAKMTNRATTQGVINAAVKGNKATIIELSCETDFVAKNKLFLDFSKELAEFFLSADLSNVKDVETAMFLDYNGTQLSTVIANVAAKTGENVKLRRFKVVTKKDNETFGEYVHSNYQFGTIIVLSDCNEEIATDIAMQVAAMKPQFLTKKDVPEAFVTAERELIEAQNAKSDKPKEILTKIIEGQLNKLLAEVCLVDQKFVKTPSKTVKKYLQENKTEVYSFIRFGVGEKF